MGRVWLSCGNERLPNDPPKLGVDPLSLGQGRFLVKCLGLSPPHSGWTTSGRAATLWSGRATVIPRGGIMIVEVDEARRRRAPMKRVVVSKLEDETGFPCFL